jgi:outer membrane protein assembly factor BamB
VKRIVVLILLATALAGCEWLESSGKPKLPGEREPVLAEETALTPDAQLAALTVRLPQPELNRDWTHDGGNPAHVMGHLALGEAPKLAWRRNVGASRDDSPENIVGSGGLAYADGRLFVSTAFANLYALDARTGKIVWRRRLSGPMRTSPTVSDGRVYQVTVDSRVHALSAEDGRRLWNHTAIEESSGILGDASPAVAADVVITAYPSGEIYAIRQVNGRTMWSDTVVAISPADPLATLAEIRADPVVDRDTVYVVSHSGRMAAINLQTGRRTWELSLGGIVTPWVAGDFIYVITNRQELVCIYRQTGTIRWITQLRRFVDLEKPTEPVVWWGPVLAGNRLLVTSSHGYIGAISPYTGKFLGLIEVGDPINTPPVVAGGTLYVMTDDATLLAYR